MPYCFPRSSIKFQGHMGQNITDFDPNWALPDYRPVAAFKSLRFALFPGCGKWPITHKDAAKLSRAQWGLNSQSSDRGNIVSCQLSSTFDSRHRDCANKHSPKGGGQPFWNDHVFISTSVYTHSVLWHRERRKETNTLHLR